MPKISVIMGVYNTGNLAVLRKSIGSILNQSFRDFEFIICDDGSTDDTYRLLQTFASQDERIILIQNKKNLGIAATSNRCLKLAKGKYIAKQDADDYSLEDRLEKQICFLESHREYSFVSSNVSYFDEDGVWGRYLLKEYPQKRIFCLKCHSCKVVLCLEKNA